MDQNSSVDNDLQKAIDDITNKTNVDPVFSDPVAAPSSIPENDTGAIEPNGPFPEPAPEPEVAPEAPSIPEPTVESPVMPTVPEPVINYSLPDEPPVKENSGLTTSEVKKAALRDLIPLLDKVHMDETQRFNIYRDIFEELKDYTVLDEAYQAAREIPNEERRAEALLYLVEAIDKM
ncbi:hypothetical protein IKE19_01175 [Candidatus Saccharibacteria bacterium]|nr:hypothetical protein [Candidatus Saccharibacteria bacterium]